MQLMQWKTTKFISTRCQLKQLETRELKCCNPDNNFDNVTPKWPKWFFERPDLDTFYFTIMYLYVFLILTCDLKVSPGAGDAAATVGGPAPVLPAVRLLLALLGAQEKQTVVRQQDSETWGQFSLIFFLKYQILSVNLPCKHVDFQNNLLSSPKYSGRN